MGALSLGDPAAVAFLAWAVRAADPQATWSIDRETAALIARELERLEGRVEALQAELERVEAP